MALTIGMVAHDRKKPDLAAWAQEHLDLIARHKVVATATTGSVLQRALPDLPASRCMRRRRARSSW